MKIKIGHLNYFTLTFYCIFNLITFFVNRHPINDLFLYVVPFILTIPVYYFVTKKFPEYKVNALLFAAFAVFATIFRTSGNATGVLFMCFSFYLYNSYKTIYILSGAIILAFIANHFIMGIPLLGMFSAMLLYSYIIIVYLIVMHPKKTYIVETDHIKYDIKIVIEYLIDGFRYKEIANKNDVYLSEDSIRQHMVKVRKYFNCKNNEQLINEMWKKGYFVKKQSQM